MSEQERAASRPRDEDLRLVVGSRATDDELRAPRPGVPGFTGRLGGVHVYALDGPDGLRATQALDEDVRVGGSLADPTNRLLHLHHEVSASTTFYPAQARGGGGDVLTLRVRDDGTLQPVERRYAWGSRPSTLLLSRSGAFLLALSRGAGGDGGGPITTAERGPDGRLHPRIHATERSVVCRVRHADGSLGGITEIVRWEGGTSDPTPALGLAPFDDLAVVAAGSPVVLRCWRLDPDRGTLAAASTSETGSGPTPSSDAIPRLAFHPTLRRVHVYDAASSTVSTHALDGGEPQTIGAISIPEQDAPVAESGDLLMDPTGSFLLLLSGRRSRLTVLEVDGDDLRIAHTIDYPDGVSPTRDAALAPGGRVLAAGSPGSGDVLVFDVDGPDSVRLRAHARQPRAAHPVFLLVPGATSEQQNGSGRTVAT